jgi:hypothetical protein
LIAEASGGPRRDRLFVGLSEDVLREIVNATLPREVMVKDELKVRLETADPYFRYSQGVIVFEGRLGLTRLPDAFLAIRMAAGLDNVDFKDGRLVARTRLYHFDLQGSTLGDMGRTVIEDLVRANLSQMSEAIPPIEIPIRLEQGITIKGLGEGPVSVKAGSLPFSASVARVVLFEQRLWIALEVGAGPWKTASGDAGS